MIKNITRDDDLARSANLAKQNVQRLAELFPEAVSEGRVDVDVLRQLLGEERLEVPGERFGLSWKGKAAARQLALQPSTGTLRPCPEESVDWDKTHNVFIEGDNLEVLKLLQKSYQGQVKLIYIDPPYNTGSDFVYPDDFGDTLANYLRLTGQIEEGRLVTSTKEDGGRFHTNWVNMMYPRLKLARSLLRDDGVIFISIDDGELPALRFLANEVFGEDNFLAVFVWKSRQNKDNRTITGASIDHEYVVCYGRSVRGDARDRSQYSNEDGDVRGDWTSANMVGIATADRRPNLHYDLVDPATGINYGCPDMGWRYDRTTMARLIQERRILWPESATGRPRRKAFLADLESDFTGISSVLGEGTFTRDGTADIDELFGARIFSYPKPVRLLTKLVEQGSKDDDIVLDFFAGSGTMGHAVALQNATDGASRRYILIQLPEPLDLNDREQKTAAQFCSKLDKPPTIAEITKERLRRAGKKLRDEKPMFAGDLGFRVYKLDSSNLKPWDPQPEDLERQIELAADHIKPGRSEADLLTELLLKLGLELTVPVEARQIAGHTVSIVGGGALLACLSPRIPRADVDTLAAGIVALHRSLQPDAVAPQGAGARPRPVRETTTVIFRDAAFVDDVAKANLTAILEQHGLHNLRSL